VQVVLAIKPYRRSLFFSLTVSGLFTPLWIRLGVVGNLGSFVLWGPLVNFILPPLGVVKWVMETERFKVWWSRLRTLVTGVCFGWGVGFFIEGYHFRIFHARIRKLNYRSLFFCRMGYFYNLLLVLPHHVRVFWRKRSFFCEERFFLFLLLCVFIFVCYVICFLIRLKG